MLKNKIIELQKLIFETIKEIKTTPEHWSDPEDYTTLTPFWRGYITALWSIALTIKDILNNDKG